MKKLIIGLSAVVLIVTIFLLADGNTQLPKGWFAAGNKPTEYEMGIDKSVFQNGSSSAFIKSKSPKENEFGTLMQNISAENYTGKRLRLSGYVKSEDVEGWSGMWMRIDGETGQNLGFDNMQERAIKGTTDWYEYEIVLDVPTGSKGIAFGVLLGGKGKVWFDNFRIEEVDKSVQITNLMKENNRRVNPINLDFEE